MPYSIKTKDGITVNNIPDAIKPDDQAVKDKVAKARADRLANAGAPTESEGGGVLSELGHQAGLAARQTLTGATNLASMIADPFINLAGSAARSLGATDYQPATIAGTASGIADKIGLPKPRSGKEEILGRITEQIPSVLSGIGLGGVLAKGAGAGTQAVGQALKAAPALQAVSATGGAAAGEVAKQAGADEGAQLAATLAGGLLAPASVGAVKRVSAVMKGAIPADKQALIDAAKSADTSLMTSDVLPPKTFAGKSAQVVGERIPIAGTGPLRAKQQAERVESIKNLANDYGLHVDTPLDAQLYKSISNKRAEDLNKYIGMKREVMDSADQLGYVPMSKTQAAIQKEIDNLETLRAPNTAAQIDELKQWKDSFGEKSFSDIDRTRRLFGEGIKDANGGVKAVFDQIPSRVYPAIKEDMAAFIRGADPASAAKWSVANKALSDGIGQLQNTKLKMLLNKGQVTPELATDMLFSARPSDVATIARNLTADGEAAARAAIIRRAINKSGGIESPSPEKFKTEMARLSPQIKQFFSGDDRKRIDGLVRVLKATERAGQANVQPITGAQNFLPIAATAAASLIGGVKALVGAATVGGMARAYESPPVRNLLLRIAATRPDSAAEKTLISKLLGIAQSQNAKDKEKPKAF